MLGLEYTDGQEPDSLNEQLQALLRSEGGDFADQYFVQCQVGSHIAVGLAGQKKKRERTVRVAAAVCRALTSPFAKRELEQTCPEIAALVKQVAPM